jgi:LL-diaminopimelate aminotransferase
VEFCADLLDKQGLVVTPGIGYGPSGEGYFRISMTAPDERIDAGMLRLKEFMRGKQ